MTTRLRRFPFFFLLLVVPVLARADITVTVPLPKRPAGVPGPVYPIPRLDWLDRFEDNLDKLKKGPYDLVFDGDSVTDYWQGAGRDVWKQHYGSLKALDIAIGGDETGHVLWRVQHGDLAGQDPNLIVLSIGSNNIGHSLQDPKDVAVGVKLILGEYEKRCPHAHILLLAIFPRGASPVNNIDRDYIARTNVILATYASDPRVTYMDIGSKFLHPDGTLTTDIMPDHLHPSAKGYAIWADAIQSVVDKYVPKSSVPSGVPVLTRPTITVTVPLPQRPAGTSLAVYPVPRVEWLKQFLGNVDKLKKGPYDLVFDGDSITADWMGTGRFVWKQRYGSLKALDIALANDNVQNILWRVQNGDLAGQDPKLIVLMAGAYNIGFASPQDIASGIKLILGEYEKRCSHAHILLLGIIPKGQAANHPHRALIAQTNAILAAYASDPRVTYMDIGSKFLQPDGTIALDMLPEHHRPAPQGYAIWADAIQPVIDQYVIKAAAP
jgi:lysophospholipase L1-like esterase